MKQKGFTLIELMVVVAIIGILLSLGIPAYQDYVIKARVSEGLQLAETAKLAVAEETMANNELPKAESLTSYKSPEPTENVQFITIGNAGVITISYTEKAGNGTIVLIPSIQKNGYLTWTCTTGTLIAKYRPASCR